MDFGEVRYVLYVLYVVCWSNMFCVIHCIYNALKCTYVHTVDVYSVVYLSTGLVHRLCYVTTYIESSMFHAQVKYRTRKIYPLLQS